MLGRLLALGEIAGAFLGLFVASALIGAIAAPHLPAWAHTPILALAMWGGVFAGWAMLRRAGRSYRALGFVRPARWIKSIVGAMLAVAIAQFGAMAIGWGIQHHTGWPPLDLGYIRQSIQGDLRAYVLWIALVVWGSAGFGEELFARGFVLDRFTRAFGGGRAAICAAVLAQAAAFGWLHSVQGPTGVVITAWVGLVFAVLYFVMGRNLWAPILAHGLTDTIGLTLIFLGLPLPGYVN